MSVNKAETLIEFLVGFQGQAVKSIIYQIMQE